MDRFVRSEVPVYLGHSELTNLNSEWVLRNSEVGDSIRFGIGTVCGELDLLNR
jgi:hypothetical protein